MTNPSEILNCYLADLEAMFLASPLADRIRGSLISEGDHRHNSIERVQALVRKATGRG